MPYILSVRQTPSCCEQAIAYIQNKWASETSRPVYEDCIRHTAGAVQELPQWYLLLQHSHVIGCAGLLPNDFISRMDLFLWLCALYIEPEYRGHAYGRLLIEQAKTDSRKAGFQSMYLCTDHIGYYERYGFTYIGDGYHPWEECSRIYEVKL